VILYVLLTHRPAQEVAAYLDDFERVLPGRNIVVCYGGTRDEFDGFADLSNALFVDDPDLRRRAGQSYTRVLKFVYERLVEPNPSYKFVHLMEYDHVVLSPQYEAELLEIMSGERVGLLAQNCTDHTMVNWCHGIDVLDDLELEGRLREISVRDQDVLSMWGGLGNGMTIGRKALEEFCRRAGDLSRFMEVYVPTVIYHLGYRVVGAPEAATLFDHVRFGPPYEREEAMRRARDGALALHPVKERTVQQDVVALAEAKRSRRYDRDDARPQSA
jgi:hypothetical protein